MEGQSRAGSELVRGRWGGGVGGGSERGTDSVPTLLITVSLETERGRPLARGNLLGPVTEREREQRWGGGLKRVYDTGTLSIVLSLGFTSLHSHQR